MSWSVCAGESELHEGAITHMALVENGNQLMSISADGIMMLSSVSVLVKGVPVGHQPSLDLPTVHLMRQSDLVALDDRIAELKNQVCCMTSVLMTSSTSYAHAELLKAALLLDGIELCLSVPRKFGS